MLGMAAQPTEHEMHNEFIRQLTNGILPLIITLFFAAIFSMLIGYRVVAKRLAQRGMKKGDARAIGQATASLMFFVDCGNRFQTIRFWGECVGWAEPRRQQCPTHYFDNQQNQHNVI